jgi:hypothetical protein
MISSMGSRAALKACGISSAPLWWKLLAEHLGSLAPKGFDSSSYPGLISCVREPTNASRERMSAYQEPGSPHIGA